MILDNNFWGADMLNVNLPEKPGKEIVFTKALTNLKHAYDYTTHLPDPKMKRFVYKGDRISPAHLDQNIDSRAVFDGKISIMPCRYDILDSEVFEKLKDQKLEIQ